ncbi:MAG: hypothetical protein WD034_01225 [Parvibaculum sp.]|uniref:hypothetical protein n=1 Tax=Parvibaculum sp. TaxID=2024848 RepID=UPI0034A05315
MAAGFMPLAPYIEEMNRIVAAALIVVLPAPAVAETSIFTDVGAPEIIEPEGPRVAPLKTFVPGHQSEHGGWVRPYEREGGPLPLPPPGQKSRGYVPGHHDAQGRWVPGHSK